MPRPFRFPPLSQVTAQAGLPPQDLQAALAQGYEQGQERGWREGYDTGTAQGQRDGSSAGHAEGLRLGAQQARDEVRARFDTLAAPLDTLRGALEQAHQDYQQALRGDLVDLVARVARQVIRCELALQPVQLLALVDETLATMPPPHKDVEVHLNPGDLQRIQEVDPARATRWSLVGDSALEAGECRVKMGSLEADAGCRQRLAACMEQVAAQLLEAPTVGAVAQVALEAPAARPPAAARPQAAAPLAATPPAAPAADAAATSDAAATPTATPAAKPARRKPARKTAGSSAATAGAGA